MPFGIGKGWGGGGGDAEDPDPPALWGPRGSGAVITPGEAWPGWMPVTTEEAVKKYGKYLLAIAVLLALADS